MLGLGSSRNRTVEQDAHNEAPEKDCEAKSTQNGTDGDEDGSIGRARVLHEGSVHSWRDRGSRVSGNGLELSQGGQSCNLIGNA